MSNIQDDNDEYCEGGFLCLPHSNKCEISGCQSCCEHSDRDSHCCLDCGKEIDLSDIYDEDYRSDE